MTETEQTERDGRPPANLVALVLEFESEQRDAEGLALLDWADVDWSRIGGAGPGGVFWDGKITTVSHSPDGTTTTNTYGPTAVRQSIARRSLGR